MGDKEDNEDLKKFLKRSVENMTRNFMQWFKFFSIQLGGKSTLGSSNSTPHDEKKTYGKVIFSKNRPHN